MDALTLASTSEVPAEPSRSRFRWQQRGRVDAFVATAMGLNAAKRRARFFRGSFFWIMVMVGLNLGMMAAMFGLLGMTTRLTGLSQGPATLLGVMLGVAMIGLGIVLRLRADRTAFEPRKLDAILRPLQILRHDLDPRTRIALSADFRRAGAGKPGAHKIQWMDLQFALLDGVRARVRVIARVKRKQSRKRRFTKVKESIQEEVHIHLKLPSGQMDPSKLGAANTYLAATWAPPPTSSTGRSAPPPPPPLPEPIPSGARGPLLVGYVDQQLAWSVELVGDETIVGRSHDCAVVVQDSEFSRRHFSIVRRGTSLWISDLGSGSGTSINGQPVHAQSHLKPGDVIEVGRHQMRVEGPPTAPPAPAEVPVLHGPAGVPQIAPGARPIRMEFGTNDVRVVCRTPTAKRTKRYGWNGDGLENLIDGGRTTALIVRSYHAMRRSMVRA